ncbi:MAG: hypothetical protein KGQ41_03980, partial [Alphaproteobacteria bacterium]|nr:hypothetical protein [Alphaproteobacteria bacterium]
MVELTHDTVFKAIVDAGKPVTKRDLARAFDLRDARKIDLKRILKELSGMGRIQQIPGKAYVPVEGAVQEGDEVGEAPSVVVLRISEITLDGDVFA